MSVRQRRTDPSDRVQEVTSGILARIHRGVPALVIDSPPGAGKTTIGTMISATAAGLLREDVMVACWTNRQAIDFAVRLARDFRKVPVQLFLREDLRMLVPDEAERHPNLTVVSAAADLEPGGVTVANAAKWTASEVPHRFTWLLVDEAYQIPELRFQQMVGMAERYVLIGDPGQIAPLIRADVSPWGCDPAGPHVPCPAALRARHPEVPTEHLPVTWRLPPDSAELVRRSFYAFEFSSGDPEGRRRLDPGRAGATFDLEDRAIERLGAPRTSIAMALLPPADVGTEVDPELAAFVARTAGRLLARRAVVHHEDGPRRLAPAEIGVVTPHRAQVAEIDKELRKLGLPTGPDAIVVETPERWQGLQRPVMLVHHPLSGLTQLSSFDLDRGRLCVMLSRHKVACLVVGRATIGPALEEYAHTGDRFPGMPDEEYLGWRAHHEVWSTLLAMDRVVQPTRA